PRGRAGRERTMERTTSKELALAPLQDWGEETEDGAVYSVSLRRQRNREQDPGFVPAFLATHRAFVPTARVLGLLLPPPPPPLPPGAVVSVLGSWLRDYPQDFWDPPAHSDLGSVCTFLGWAAPSGAEAREAEKLLGDFLKDAEPQQEEEEQSQTWAGNRYPLSGNFRRFFPMRTTTSAAERFSPRYRWEEATEENAPPGSLPSKPPPGPIPYLGTFLTDLVMLDTALPDMLEAPVQTKFAPRGISSTLRRGGSYRISRVIEPPAASCPSSPRVRRRISLTKRLSAKLSRERGSSPGGSPKDPSSSTSSLSPASPPSSPRTRDPPPGSPPASPGPQGPSTKLPLSPDLPGPRTLALPLSGPHIALPGQQGSEACVIRVSIDNDHGNLYRSILLTSQDKAPSVVQRALEKHNVAQPWARDYQLFQVLPGDRELLIPDNANVFYAMSPAAPGDFVLRRKERARHTTSDMGPMGSKGPGFSHQGAGRELFSGNLSFPNPYSKDISPWVAGGELHPINIERGAVSG
ncbi:hypothetical protein E2I00_011960, partial [Balaenoptera physalus]